MLAPTHVEPSTYLINLIIFNGWGVIYTILGSLMAVINVNQVSNLMADQILDAAPAVHTDC